MRKLNVSREEGEKEGLDSTQKKALLHAVLPLVGAVLIASIVVYWVFFIRTPH